MPGHRSHFHDRIHVEIDAAIDAVKLGAFHYVSKPFKLNEIRLLAQKAMEHKSLVEENAGLRARLQSCGEPTPMIGMSPVIKDLFGLIAKVAPLNCNVLIQGESGTGKELVARSIHEHSLRKDKPFVAFNCAGFTENSISSELFGYERGSFTGATSTKIGILETADGGTVFMDEIGDMPLSMQAKLLRVIQERQIRRVGATKSKELDLRFVAATNKDLKRAVQDGGFRDDLYFRLKVVQLDVPSLSQRKEDIPILIRHFTSLYSRQFSKPARRMDPTALDILLNYTYPGNVRELPEDIVERAVALADGETITVRDLPPELRENPVSHQRGWLTLEQQSASPPTSARVHELQPRPRGATARPASNHPLEKDEALRPLQGG